MRRLVAAVGVTALAVGIVGCSTEGSAQGSSAEGSLTILWDTGSKNGLEAVIEAFEEEHEGVDVEVEYLDSATLNSQIPTRLAAGTGPDIFRGDGGRATPKAVLALADRELLAPLESAWVAELPETVSQPLESDGEIYGFPIALAGTGAVYNDQLMEEHGLTAPRTWDEVLQFCRDARAAGTVAYNIGAATPYEGRATLEAFAYETVYADTPKFDEEITDGSLTWPESGWGDAIDRQGEMVDAGCYSDGFAGVDFQTAFGDFFAGKTLGWIGVSSYLQSNTSDYTFSFQPIPTSNDPDASGMSIFPFGTIGQNAEAKNAALATEFIDFMARPEINELYVSNLSSTPGMIPVFYDQENPPSDQVSAKILEYLDNGKNYTLANLLYPGPEVTAAMESNMQVYLTDNATKDQVLQAIQDAYMQLVD